MSIAKQIRHLVLGEDGLLSKAEALALVSLIAFTIQVALSLVHGWSETDILGLATLAGYCVRNKLVGKINKK